MRNYEEFKLTYDFLFNTITRLKGKVSDDTYQRLDLMLDFYDMLTSVRGDQLGYINDIEKRRIKLMDPSTFPSIDEFIKEV